MPKTIYDRMAADIWDGEGYPTALFEAFREGFIREQRRIVRVLLEARFGALPDDAVRHLEGWPPKKLEELALAISTAPSLQALGLAD